MILRPNRRRFMTSCGVGLTAAYAMKHAHARERLEGPIRVGQIGVGHAHATKLGVYRELPDYEVVAVAEPNEELWQAASSRAPFRDVPRSTIEQLLDDRSIQVILVETEVSDLLNIAERCIAADKHIHLDKPAGSSMIQFRRICQQAEQRQRMIQMGYMYRYNPAVVLLNQFLASRWLGEIFEVHAVMSKVVPPAGRQRLAAYPGGIMFELGCHLMDLVIGVLGKPNKTTSVIRRVLRDQDELNDNMLAILEYDKAVATVKSSAVEVEGFARRHLAVCGTEGTFHIQPLDNPQVTLSLARDRGQYRRGTQTIRLPRYTRYVDDAIDMARVLRGEKPSDFAFDHDLVVQETLLQACGLPLSD